MVLRDEEINRLLADNPSAVTPRVRPLGPAADRSLQIQPSSLDLTIGGIFRPDAVLGKKGSVGRPYEKLGLLPGHTAVVETQETLNLPDDICAIGFPPHHVSSKGILMTNPGHVDPGYQGKLTFTVINMGRDSYPLSQGLGIVTLLLFQLRTAPLHPYSVLYAPSKGSAVTWEVLHTLSEDFLNVDKRARRIAQRQATRAAIGGSIVALIVGLLTVFGYILTTYNGLNAKVTDLEKQIAVIEATMPHPTP